MTIRRGPVQADDGGAVFETRDDGTQLISGMAAVFHRGDDAGTEFTLFPGVVERVSSEAFTRALSEEHDVRGLINHDPNLVLGRTKSGTLTLSKTKRGLRYEIPYDEEDPDHRNIRRKLEKGDISGSSFGFRVTGESWHNEGDTEVRTITDVDLLDVSPVTYPAYKSTSSGFRQEDVAEIRDALARHTGISKSLDACVIEDVLGPLDTDRRVDDLQDTIHRLEWRLEELEARLAESL